MAAKGPSHWSCWPGKQVIVKLHNGTEITGRFEAKRSTYLVVEGKKIARKDIRVFSLLKHAIRCHGK